MRHLIISLPALLITACGSGETEPQSALATGPCADIETIQAARRDKTPFESLRGENFRLDDWVMDDQWHTKAPLFNVPCKTSVMEGFSDNDGDIYILGCELYADSSAFAGEEAEAGARTRIEAMRQTLETCLGEGWASKERTESGNHDVYLSYTFKPVDFVSPFSFAADPVYVEMTYNRFGGRSGNSGWLVKVQFQEQVTRES